MTEEYALYDDTGTFIASRRVLYRLKLLMESGKSYMVRGTYSGLELKVGPETTSQDWRRFEVGALEEMDALSDYIGSLVDEDTV